MNDGLLEDIDRQRQKIHVMAAAIQSVLCYFTHDSSERIRLDAALSYVPPETALNGVGNDVAIERKLVAALEFYANREHYVFDGLPDDWDSVSGEPQNWLCAPSIPAHDKELDLSWMIEDGGVARAALEECTKLARKDMGLSTPSQGNVNG